MTSPSASDPFVAGPLDRATAEALLAQADRLLATSEFEAAGAVYTRLIGFDDPAITGAAFVGAGEARYRQDDETGAVWHWEQATKLPENRTTYIAWRQVAAARVRAGELRSALDAYREAERRAPPADRPEIASRLGWLTKELGDTRGAGRYFARSRGAETTPIVCYSIMAVTVVMWIVTLQPGSAWLSDLLILDKVAVAHGEWWRLVTPVLLHDPQNILHILFNMYALYLFGPLVEQLYGSARFLLIYVLTAATASTLSFLIGSDRYVVGASGAIFGLLGMLLAVSFVHKPVLDRRGQAMVSQIGFIIIVNLFIGFGLMGGYVDNWAHIGGMLGGLWLGLVLPPVNAATLAQYWRRPTGSGTYEPLAGAGDHRVMGLLRALAVLALAVVVVVGVVIGTPTWV